MELGLRGRPQLLGEPRAFWGKKLLILDLRAQSVAVVKGSGLEAPTLGVGRHCPGLWT